MLFLKIYILIDFHSFVYFSIPYTPNDALATTGELEESHSYSTQNTESGSSQVMLRAPCFSIPHETKLKAVHWYIHLAPTDDGQLATNVWRHYT